MPSRSCSTSQWLLLVVLAATVGCSDGPKGRTQPDSWKGVCIDLDGDGFGFQCSAGEDCDDTNRSLTTDCRCAAPDEGCACDPSATPVDCQLPKSVTEQGTLLCRTGKRYCRDGAWTACEGIVSFEVEAPARLDGRVFGALIDQDAAPVQCDPCHPDCYRVDDPLEVVNDASVGTNTISNPGGGLTLSSSVLDGGVASGGLLDDTTCTPGVAPDVDCDGIPDDYDPYPSAPPFATNHNTIFMDLAPGDQGEESFEIVFYLNTADIYFYLDMTASMEDERDNLINSLTTGNFLPSAGAGVECADRNFNGSTADEEVLKNQGIAGNLACLIRDSKLGAGWFRDIPFPGPYANGIKVAPYDFPPFEHRQDITNDVEAVRTALSGFQTRGNYNTPEGSMQGLWALATGGEVYMGWDRPGIPSRQGCPMDTWGWPCFRADAVPIVIHITDAPMQNGPATSSGNLGFSNNPINYDNNVLDDYTAGTEGTYRHLTASADTLGNAQHVGVIDDVLVTYVGDTETMSSDLAYGGLGTCPSGQTAWSWGDQAGKDAVFRFSVASPKQLMVSARGSRFDNTLMILRTGVGIIPRTETVSGNATVATAYDLGMLPVGIHAGLSGNTSGYSKQFTRDTLGCLAGTGASDTAEAAVFKFRLPEDMPMKFSSAGTSSSFFVASSLFNQPPVIPTDTDEKDDLAGNGIRCAAAPTTFDDDCNDKFGDFNLGDVTGKFYRLVDADTTNASVDPDFPADGFVAAGCPGVSGTSDDMVVDFSVSAPTRVRIETTGNNSAMTASFNHSLALIERPATILPIQYNPSGNDTQATADAAHAAEIFESEVLGLDEGGWVQYVGNSETAAADYAQTDVGGNVAGVCHNGNRGGNTSYKDVVFKFVVTQTQSYDFDTFPTNPEFGYKTWLSLHKGTINAFISQNIVNIASLDDHDFSDGVAGQAVLSPAQGTLDARRVLLLNGRMDQRDASLDPAVMGCGSTTGNALGGRDALFRFHLDNNTRVHLVTTKAAATVSSLGSPGFDSFLAVFRDSISAGTRMGSTCPNPTGNGAELYADLQGGHDYYVVVKQWQFANLNSTSGGFGLMLEDSTNYGVSGGFVECDAGSHPNSSVYSKITRTLDPGTYYLVVKGPASGSYYNYQLNVRKTPATPPIIECKNHVNRQATIERNLAPGNYSVVVRGMSSSDRGTYNLSIRDLAVSPAPLSCHNTQTGVRSFERTLPALDQNGQPIDYYLVMRGNTTGGAYSVSIDDSRSGTVACSDDDAVAINDTTTLDDAEIITTLQPGDYTAVLKGYDSADQGWFQITFGDKTKQQSGLFAAKKWLGPAGDGVGGIREALQTKGVRVITVRSSTDTATKEQSIALANATGAVSTNGSPLTFTISSTGTGMGSAVIDAVNLLAGNLSMDVGVVLREEPDNPTPNFDFKVEAIDTPGDSCDPPIDADGDAQHLPDTHLNCRPGATPRFKVTFKNPAPPNSVPINPGDPNGGYNMKLQLIGDGTYVVDQIPVYIIPEAVVPDPGDTIYASQGTYEQTINSSGCMAGERPLWRDITWNATVPGGTKVTWQLCGADTDAELAACSTWKTAGVLQSGGTCNINDPTACDNGYCDSSGVCHYVSAPANTCTTAADCGTAGICVANTCLWRQSTIDLKPIVAAGLNGKKKMRVRVVLESNASRTSAPTIHDWRLDYVCTPLE